MTLKFSDESCLSWETGIPVYFHAPWKKTGGRGGMKPSHPHSLMPRDLKSYPEKSFLWWNSAFSANRIPTRALATLAPAQPSPISSVQLVLWNTNLQRPKYHCVQSHSCYCCSDWRLSFKAKRIISQRSHIDTRNANLHQKKKKSNQPQPPSKVGFCRKSKKMCRICTFSSGPHMFPAELIRQGYFPYKQSHESLQVKLLPSGLQKGPECSILTGTDPWLLPSCTTMNWHLSPPHRALSKVPLRSFWQR